MKETVVGKIPETSGFPDPFWLEHGERIRAIRNVIESPKTRVGEEIREDTLSHPVFIVYNRLHPIFSSLVALIEYDEIGKAEGKNYFSEPLNQRMVLRALGLLVEDNIKFPYSGKKERKYEDYRRFFEGVILRFGQLEKEIQTGKKTPKFVNSLSMIINQEAAKLKGVENFGIKIEVIRKKIAAYLPKLEVNNQEILAEIKDRLETALVVQPQDKK